MIPITAWASVLLGIGMFLYGFVFCSYLKRDLSLPWLFLLFFTGYLLIVFGADSVMTQPPVHPVIVFMKRCPCP